MIARNVQKRVSKINKTKTNSTKKRKHFVIVDESHPDDTDGNNQNEELTVLVPKIVYSRTKKLRQNFQRHPHPAVIDDNMTTLEEAAPTEMTNIKQDFQW